MSFYRNIQNRRRIFFIKLLHWEYWNSAVLYFPIMPYLAFLWLRAKSFFFYNAANPGIKNGGFLMESKWQIHNDAPADFFPETLMVHPTENFTLLSKRISGLLNFPFVAKPDIGGKGKGVAIIHNMQQLKHYHNTCPLDYIVQQKIHFPLEAGIFYVRLPNQAMGQITGIVQKKFVQVTGNGNSTVSELLQQNPRYFLQLKSLQKIIDTATMQQILPAGNTKLLIDIGNHARGSYFVNAAYRISPKLTKTMDELCKKFPGFYFGRLDIRFNTWEELEAGKNIGVIELNGSGSEPTHIYDPANSIWYVWKEICRHWYLMYRISIYHHANGIPYLSFKQGIQMFKEDKIYHKKMKGFDFKPYQITTGPVLKCMSEEAAK